ncbi:MAG: glycosyltransferase [Nitrospirae bacterium]|nr:glycosyltransferase [Nitrospirota bacterium]
MKISVSIITMNELHNLRRAVSSCTFADEIVIVDGGSTDGTIDFLGKQDRVVLIEHPWENDFGKQRQVSLEKCTGDWVIRIDSDEVFSKEFEENIRAVLGSVTSDVSGCRIRQCNLIGNEKYYSRMYDDFEAMPRIWRNLPGIRWEGVVHEILRGMSENFITWDTYVVHYGFLDKMRYWKKGELYSTISGSGFESPQQLVYRDYDMQPTPRKAKIADHVPPYDIQETVSRLPRVAIVRGPGMQQAEMQNYEPLMNRFDMTVYTSDPELTSRMKLPVINLPFNRENPDNLTGLEAELFDKDIIFTADIFWMFTYQAVIAKMKFGKRVIALESENIPFVYEEFESVRQMKQISRKLVDHFVAVTEGAKAALMLEGVPEEKITVIPVGVDTGRFRPDADSGMEMRDELGIRPDEI